MSTQHSRGWQNINDICVYVNRALKRLIGLYKNNVSVSHVIITDPPPKKEKKKKQRTYTTECRKAVSIATLSEEIAHSILYVHLKKI